MHHPNIEYVPQTGKLVATGDFIPTCSRFAACLSKAGLRPLRAAEGGRETPFTLSAPLSIGQI
ncbi:hypothetical protein EYF80_013951 [Liparis tanakae]|uniref:Uncharacterized protein n=1 Tax=Liparis tanakae TaxID=230148 RepID=A0A4Z2IED6_9TELE|nr:hypothetical protein EYF80_013951 [Liparis tanakae]